MLLIFLTVLNEAVLLVARKQTLVNIYEHISKILTSHDKSRSVLIILIAHDNYYLNCILIEI